MKKLLFSLMSVFLIYQSVKLLDSLSKHGPESLGFLECLLWAYILCLFITGVFAFPGFVFQLYALLGKSYYRIVRPKVLKAVFKNLGVEYFRRGLMLFFWGSKKNRAKFFSGGKDGLQNLIIQTKQSEFGHVGGFLAVTAAIIYLLCYQHYLLAGLCFLINIVGNLYPVILQRHHRMRIERMMRIEEKKG